VANLPGSLDCVPYFVSISLSAFGIASSRPVLFSRTTVSMIIRSSDDIVFPATDSGMSLAIMSAAICSFVSSISAAGVMREKKLSSIATATACRVVAGDATILSGAPRAVAASLARESYPSPLDICRRAMSGTNPGQDATS
jgi:hypothetical protein